MGQFTRTRTPMIVTVLMGMITSMIVILGPSPAGAQTPEFPADLDPSWGATTSTEGVRTGRATFAFQGTRAITNVAGVHSFGDRAVVVGTVPGAEAAPANLFVAGLDADGDIDPTFGTNGFVEDDLTGDGYAEQVTATATDGKTIVVVGSVSGFGNTDMFVARYLYDGTRDTTFAAPTGVRFIDASADDERANGVAIDSQGRIIVVGRARNGTHDDLAVVRLLGDGSPDATWGTNGIRLTDVATAVSVEAVPVDDEALGVAVTATDGVVVAGATLTGGDFFWDHVVARFTTTGSLDTSWSSDGVIVTSHGDEDRARTVVLDDPTAAPSSVTVVGDVMPYSGTMQVVVSRFSADGTPLATAATGFVTGEHALAGAAIALADAEALFVGQSGLTDTLTSSRFGVGRLRSGALDPSFDDDDGRIEVWCEGGGGGFATAAATQFDGKYLVGGTCGGYAMVARLWGDHVPPPTATPAIDGLTLSATSSAPAGRERTPLSGLDALAALAGQESDLQAAPLRNTPLRNTPLRNTPLRNTPLRNTPLRNTPLRNTTLAPILLSEVPLRNASWSTVLVGSPYEGVPLQTVTLDDVFALPDADTRLTGITLEMIDLSKTPLRNTTLTGLLLGALTLDQLPPPAGGWCAFLHDGGACTNADELASTTLFEVEISGYDLSAYYAQPLGLGALPLAGTVLGGLILDTLRLVDTSLGAVAAADVASVLDCGGSCTGTLAEAQAAGRVRPDATVAELVGLLPVPGAQDVSLGQLLVGILPLESLPFEDLPLDVIVDSAELRTSELINYAASFVVDCTRVADVAGRITPAHGARLVPGKLDVDPSTVTAELTAPATPGGSYGLDLGGTCVGTDGVTVTFQGEPPVELGDVGGTTLELTADAFATSSTATSNGYTSTARGGDTATPVGTSHLYTGHLEEPGDVDLFTVPAPAPGSRLTVSLSHLPADYDLVLYGPDPDDPTTAPLRNTPLRNTPLRNTPLRNTPLRNTGLGDASDEPGTDSTSSAPDRLQDVPLRNTPLRNTSINPGTENESASTLVRGSDEGGTFTIQVSGFNAASSPEPYVLRVTTAPRLEPLTCVSRPYVGGVPGTLPGVASATADVETLLLVNQQRLGAAYPQADITSLMQQLHDLAADPTVNGLVIPVDGDGDVSAAYVKWDEDPCSIDAANGVVDAVNGLVDGYLPTLPNLRHLVLVGGDEMLPQARVPDLTTVGNQVEYTEDLRFDLKDNPVSSAARESHVLTDDPYGDLDPMAWLDGQLYVPDVALGRLVESPEEISAAITAYLQAGGRLDPSTSFVAGYDFLTDGAGEVKDALDPNGTQQHRIDETWTADDAIAGMAADRFASVNAHYDHYQGLPALTHAGGAPDLFSTGQLSQDLSGSVLFTMGCNAGLSVADVFVSTPAADDWAQALSARGALFTGNTGFGYGDTEFVAYSEALMARYARNLAGGQMTAGQALMYAKQGQLAELGVPGVYDAKAMEESTFYGLPMYRIGPAGTSAAPALPIVLPTGTTDVTVATETETVTPFGTTVPAGTTVDRGTFWAVPGHEPQVSHFRPIQPRTSVDVTATDGLVVRGALLEELTSVDILGVDPIYATPTIDLSGNEPEADITDTVFPTRLHTVTSHPSPEGWRDRLVLMAGQFATDDEAGDGTGTQRLFTRMSATVYRSDSADFTPPAIAAVDGAVVDGAAMFQVVTPDDDVQRVVVLYLLPGETVWRKAELAGGTTGTWSGMVDVGTATEVPQFLVQVLDRAGNVGSTINKSFGYRADELVVDPGQIVAPVALSPAPTAGGYFVDDPTVTIGAPDDGVTYESRVDGGPWTAYVGPFTLTGERDAAHHLEVRGSDGSVADVWAAVDRSGPVVTVHRPTPTAQVIRNSTLVSHVSCADAVSGVASCPDGQALDTTTLGTRTVEFTASDVAGRSSKVTLTYEVVPHVYRFDGFYEPIQNGAVNVVQAGRSVPVKFRLYDGDVLIDDTTRITTKLVSSTCDSSQTENNVDETVSSSEDGGLKWDPVEQQFVFVHKTGKKWTGCKTLTFTVTHPDATTSGHVVVFSYER